MSDDPKSEEEVYYSQSYKILKQKLEGTTSFEYNENITTVKNSTLQRDFSPSKSPENPSRSKSGSRADHIAAPPLKELKMN